MAAEGGGEQASPASSQQQEQARERNEQQQQATGRPLILITEPQNSRDWPQLVSSQANQRGQQQRQATEQSRRLEDEQEFEEEKRTKQGKDEQKEEEEEAKVEEREEDQFEVVDGISYRIVAAVTTKKRPAGRAARQQSADEQQAGNEGQASARSASVRRRRQSSSQQQQQSQQQAQQSQKSQQSRLSVMRRKSSAFVANLSSFLVPNSRSSHELGGGASDEPPRPRRMSIYEMTKSPPPETSIEMYLNERRRSSTVSATFVQQQLEQQSTFETNYCARQQYFKDLNEKLINQDKRLLNVVANRGQMHRHSVDIAQLPLELAQANAAAARKLAAEAETLDELQEDERENEELAAASASNNKRAASQQPHPPLGDATINQVRGATGAGAEKSNSRTAKQLASICEHGAGQFVVSEEPEGEEGEKRHLLESWKLGERRERRSRAQVIKKKFAQFDGQSLSSAPAPDVKIGQRVAYKEYYGNEFGTIRWIGRVPQISANWTVGVEFDNAIGEGDGSLHGRRYFIAKDCFAKFLPLANVALVDQHVGRPEPGTMISVMSAAVRPGQMISIQRVSTVHVQHCFLNAPHRRPGAEFLAINTRLHCQCPNCGPCAHVVKPPRTQRLRTPKNATHMCQFSTYTCCGMESSEDALCTYTGNKISSLPPPGARQNSLSLPALAGSWIEGAGYLSTLQAEQRKLMPEEYRIGAAPDDEAPAAGSLRRNSSAGRRHQHRGVSQLAAAPACGPEAHQHQRHRHRHRQRQRHRRHRLSEGHSSKRHRHKHRRKQPRHQHHSPQAPPPVYSEIAASPAPQLPQPEVDKYPSALGDSLSLAVSPADKSAASFYGDEHEPTLAAAAGDEPLKPRIVYRDSIENRYLFPTDDLDAIDSTLEQDLEELSLARYGYLARNGERKHTRSCPSSGNSSRNLLVKSLRSLVSCLSAKQGSELDSVHGAMRVVGERPLSGGATPSNKSRPMVVAPSGSWRRARSSSASSSSCCSSSCSSPSKGQFHFSRQRAFYEPLEAHHQMLKVSQDAQAAAAPFQAVVGELPATAPPPFAAGQPVRRQISSSSDCGFSSASQNSNSANFVASPLLQTATSQQEQLDELETRRLGAIYERLAARLIQSSSASSPVTAEDLLKLRRSLFELGAQSAANSNSLEMAGSQLDCCEQLLAELIKRSLLRPQSANGARSSSSSSSSNNNNNNNSNTKPKSCEPPAQSQPSEQSSHRGSSTAPTAASNALPRAFELKLTLCINENAKRQLQNDTGAALTSAALTTGATSDSQPPAHTNLNLSLAPPVVAGAEQQTAS